MPKTRYLSYAQYYNMRADQFQPDDVVSVRCVAVIGEGKTWAAYAGLSGQTDAEIAANGDKMDRRAAEALFPTIAASFAWRR